MDNHLIRAAFALGFVASVFSPTSDACSCSPCNEASLSSKRDAFAFFGQARVLNVENDRAAGKNIIVIQPVEDREEPEPAPLTIETQLDEGLCGARFSEGASVPIAAYERSGVLHTNSCIQSCWQAPSLFAPGEEISVRLIPDARAGLAPAQDE